jgi:hypothetical protein
LSLSSRRDIKVGCWLLLEEEEEGFVPSTETLQILWKMCLRCCRCAASRRSLTCRGVPCACSMAHSRRTPLTSSPVSRPCSVSLV